MVIERTLSLFEPPSRTIELDKQSTLYFEPKWLSLDEAQQLNNVMRTKVAWKHEELSIMGKKLLQPRLTAWYGDSKAYYTYSGLQNTPLPWFRELEELRNRVEELCGVEFNSALLNLYRNGQDSMGYHSDDEKELGKNPLIASVSLGATRKFLLRHKHDVNFAKHDLQLSQGSLLVMKGATQHFYKHSIPKTKMPVGERINITFRHVLTDSAVHEL